MEGWCWAAAYVPCIFLPSFTHALDSGSACPCNHYSRARRARQRVPGMVLYAHRLLHILLFTILSDACDIIIFTLALLSLLLVLLLTIPIVLSALNHSHAPIAYFLTTRFHIHRRMGVQTARILQLGAYAILGVFWLAGAAFGTSRWKGVPMKCPTVAEVDEDDAEAMVRWCNDLKALRVMVWVLWVGCKCFSYRNGWFS